ncbi:MAG: hypothetical protein D3924_17890 [Candidatus Electrothrix sp. AR4]|nr:hypothetical protein [Candidatus Electrothrix sp. AR4]
MYRKNKVSLTVNLMWQLLSSIVIYEESNDTSFSFNGLRLTQTATIHFLISTKPTHWKRTYCLRRNNILTLLKKVNLLLQTAGSNIF